MKNEVKKIKYRDKLMIIIPETNLVKGTMRCKWIDKDLRGGYKPIYKIIIDFVMGILYPNMDIPFNKDQVIEAYAYCDNKDTYDEKVGIEVCSAKLEMKNHIKLAKAYNRLCKVLTETADIAYQLCKKHVDKANAIEEDLARTYGRMKV